MRVGLLLLIPFGLARSRELVAIVENGAAKAYNTANSNTTIPSTRTTSGKLIVILSIITFPYRQNIPKGVSYRSGHPMG